jgi:hypothetical protein
MLGFRVIRVWRPRAHRARHDVEVGLRPPARVARHDVPVVAPFRGMLFPAGLADRRISRCLENTKTTPLQG